MMKDYYDFLTQKRVMFRSTGVAVSPDDIHPLLFPFQRDLTRWALRKGRSAIFADTGMGKSLMQLEWARLIGGKVIIIAPLSVAQQTANREAPKLGLTVHYIRSQEAADAIDGNLFIVNYEMIKTLNPDKWDAVVLDESSILKGLTGATRRRLTDMFSDTQYKLCCTATPAPNDIAEIANHAEFLGILTRVDMLSAFFVNDDQGWRLRGHARENFYRWLASWGMSVKKPSDLGYEDRDFILPTLNVHLDLVKSNYVRPGQLFFTGMRGLRDRIKIRRATLKNRVNATRDLVMNSREDQWIVWCGLNDESRQLTKMIPDAVEVAGSDSMDSKVEKILGFQDGKYRVLVTKPKIAGFGMNFQNCHQMAFVGLSDSFESYYQCIRRCWRFMQEHDVNVHVVLADVEEAIWQNVRRKEEEARIMSDELIKHVAQYEAAELLANGGDDFPQITDTIVGDNYTLMLGDSVERMREIGNESVDLSIFSPPFLSLYTYSPTERDLGNSLTETDFFKHFGYIIDELLRVTKPGRICAVHTSDVPAMLGKDGYIGLKDFPGRVIVAFEERGWIYHGRVTIDKNPQLQAIRTHSKALLFNQLRKDSSWSRPALGDYILAFRCDGINEVPITPVESGELTNEVWIEWAHPVWYGIRESDTLQYRRAKDKNDDKHVCPLQLPVIRRCVTLWSNKGETVLSPFAGIGSEVYIAVQMGRKGIGIELKQSYFDAMVRHVKSLAIEKSFDLFE